MSRPPSKRTLQRRAQRELENAGMVFVSFWTHGDALTEKLEAVRLLDPNVSDIPERRNEATRKLVESFQYVDVVAGDNDRF